MCGPTGANQVKVLVVYGSECGSTKSEGQMIIEKLEKEKVTAKLMEGNDAADEFDQLRDNYNVLLVLTSSYGDGDPPSGFGKFLYQLYEAAKSQTKALEGLEHSVLGFGSTTYYTFQNVPRLSDRLLEEAGSRRFLMRSEIDEMDDENEKKVDTWCDAVVKRCVEKTKSTTVPTDSVCTWEEPEKEVFEKKLGPDGYELGNGPGNSAAGGLIIAVLVAMMGAYYYYRKQQQEIGEV